LRERKGFGKMKCPECKSHTFKGDIDGNIVTLKCVDCGFVWKQGESPEKILIEVIGKVKREILDGLIEEQSPVLSKPNRLKLEGKLSVLFELNRFIMKRIENDS
jgi:hypothetical protein